MSCSQGNPEAQGRVLLPSLAATVPRAMHPFPDPAPPWDIFSAHAGAEKGLDGAREGQDTSQVTDCKFLGPGSPSLTTLAHGLPAAPVPSQPI